MKVGIVGHTGLVGGYLLEIYPDAKTYNSSNINEIETQKFDLLFVSAMPAVKWWANQNPKEDLENRLDIQKKISKVMSSRTVLISTVDVFANPNGADEATLGKFQAGQAYGQNRREFELFIQDTFPKTWIVRLPGLVGRGLKKNVLFDLKHGKSVESVPINSTFQFYPLNRLNKDLALVLAYEPGVFHFAAEPLSMSQISAALDVPETNFAPSSEKAPQYNFLTKKLGRDGSPYLVSKAESLKAITDYVFE